jgi:glycosyltransferase involved in cell wall biosynthesis
MRVAIDTNGLYTGQAGVARYIRGLLRGLANVNRSVDWFPLAWEVENLAYRQPARACKTAYRELLWANLLAPRLLKQRPADLYHATGSYFISVPPSVKCVVTLHDLAILRNPGRFRPWQRWAETRRLQRLRTVDRIICISQFTANEAQELLDLPPSRLEVVYNGGDFQPHDTPVPEQAPDFNVPSGFFLFVGSLEPGKNLALLRDAYQLAAARKQPLPPLLVVGVRWAGVSTEGPPPENWQYLGRQPDAVLVHLYRRARALIFPSKYEGFGLPVVEAMALGCPVLCSPVASLPEVGGKAVFWSNLTAADYLTAMRKLASDEMLRTELIEAGREQAARFTWERCAQGVLDVYSAVCKSA